MSDLGYSSHQESKRERGAGYQVGACCLTQQSLNTASGGPLTRWVVLGSADSVSGRVARSVIRAHRAAQ